MARWVGEDDHFADGCGQYLFGNVERRYACFRAEHFDVVLHLHDVLVARNRPESAAIGACLPAYRVFLAQEGKVFIGDAAFKNARVGHIDIT
ncbi:hypothetical protein D3C76_1048880 [compost metagenome]